MAIFGYARAPEEQTLDAQLANLVAAGAVAERLGHFSIQRTLDTHGHVLPSMQERRPTTSTT